MPTRICLRESIGLGSFLGMAGVLSTCLSPKEVALDKQLSLATSVGATILHVGLHVYLRADLGETTLGRKQKEMWTMRGARTVLAGVFVYNLLSDVAAIQHQAFMMSTQHRDDVGCGDDKRLGLSIAVLAIKAGFVFVVGLTAVGAFRSNIDTNERLEVLVQERTTHIRQQDSKLQMLGLALQSSETAMAITDAEKRIIWVNPAMAQLSGQSEKDMQNQSVLEVLSLSSGHRKQLLQAFQATSKLNKQSRRSNLINMEEPLMVGSTVVTVEVSSLVLPHLQQQEQEDHKVVHDSTSAIVKSSPDRFVVALKDVTEAQALRKAQRSAEQDALMAKVMKDSMETLTHELRTPLQGIMGVCSMLVCDKSLILSDEAKDSLDLIMASSGLLLVLINNLLDIRKCDSNMMDGFQLHSTPSHASMRDSVAFCRPLAKISGSQLEVQTENTEHAMIMANDLRLQQIIINLISNGIKFTPGGSTILIQSAASTLGKVRQAAKAALACGAEEQINSSLPSHSDNSSVLVISVVDSGSGITVGQEHRLFQKFAQLDSQQENLMDETGQPGGTGLGLNLCLRFVQLMGGNIWVNNNTQGTGATFSFYLPMASNSPATPNSSCRPTKLEQKRPSLRPVYARQTSSRPLVKPLASTLRVLVVDDILINRKVLDRMLRRIGVVTLKTAESGKDALLALESDPYDLVISDLQMPGMSGMELSAEIQKRVTIPQKPVIVGLTADTSPDLHGLCIESGMVDLIHKPITVVELGEYFDKTIAIQLSLQKSKRCSL